LALSKPGRYSGIAGCLKSILKEEGIIGLYKGWTASVYGIIPYSAVNLTLYNIFKDKYTKRLKG